MIWMLRPRSSQRYQRPQRPITLVKKVISSPQHKLLRQVLPDCCKNKSSCRGGQVNGPHRFINLPTSASKVQRRVSQSKLKISKTTPIVPKIERIPEIRGY